MRTLATVLDHLVNQKVQSAADVVMQRYAACEKAVADSNWSRAKFQELVPQEGLGLTDVSDERALIEQVISALFTIPKKDGTWTVILNSEWDQWGAYDYDAKLDVARFEVK